MQAGTGLEFTPALRAEDKILISHISAGRASAHTVSFISAVYLAQMLREDIDILATRYPSSDIWIKTVSCPAACGFSKILFFPFENRDKKERQAHTGHVDPISAISAAAAAYHNTAIIFIVPPLRIYSYHKKHILSISCIKTCNCD